MSSTHTRALLVFSISWALGCGGAAAPAGSDAATPRVDAASVDSGAEADAALPPDAARADTGSAVDSGSELADAYIQRSCGPADGPAFQLDLFQASVAACTVDDTLRTIGFYVHDLGGATIPPGAGDVIASTPTTPHGTANRCPGGAPACESTATWTLTFTSYVDGTGAMGTYSVTWEDGSVSAGQFDAGWCGDRPLCG